jgi:UDP-glucose 4-epimerase
MYDVAIFGAGFVGSALAKYLSSQYKVVTFDVNPKPPLLKDTETIEHRVCDIRRYQEIKEKIGKSKIIIHTAIVQIPSINQMQDYAYEVNVIGTHNVCKITQETNEVLGLILCGSWHVFGEREYGTTVDASFGYRPDKVEERARLYVISKMIQEGIVRFYNSMTKGKTYAIIRLGTVLGENMPEKTAANIFITNGLKGRPITPFKHTMHRPMLYISINDVCKVFKSYIRKLLQEDKPVKPADNGIYNLFYPEPITILELAETIKDVITRYTRRKIIPKIEIVDKGLPILFNPNEKNTLNVDISKTIDFFGIKKLESPKEIISQIVKKRLTSRFH